ncbi:arginine--tRNA ligase [Candidatus Woesebacteria bacterium]|nr:arginine--tRNA ligase [Candidatus Woesebacteria bacterium]
MLKQKIHTLIQTALEKSGLPTDGLMISTPTQESFGDYSTSIALQLAKKEKKNPMEIAEQIVEKIELGNLIENAEVMRPGFINVWVSKKQLLVGLNNAVDIPSYHLGDNHKIMVEYAHPNTLKLFHIGHLRNITTGECISRILEAVGNTVIRTNYQGDVGLHIAKTLWAAPEMIEEAGKDKVDAMSIREKIGLLGKSYVRGSKAYEEDENAKKEIIEINKKIYTLAEDIMPLYDQTRGWSLEYFQEKYDRAGTKFDKLYLESQMAKRAIELIDELKEKGILEESDGAVIFNGEGHGVHTRVFKNTHGYPTYEGKELPLSEKETTDFGELDKIIHVVTGEQTSFFATTFKVEELMDPSRFKDKQYHLVYGWVHLKGGKMSSRKGNVVEGEWVLDEAKKAIITEYKSDKQVAEKLAIAAIKFSFLKNGLQGDVNFDLTEAITLQGNSGPYIVYTYVRCKSILSKMEHTITPDHDRGSITMNAEELSLLRTFSKYPEVVKEAAVGFAPNYITTYLYDLSQKYNLFYQKHQILKEENEDIKSLRLKLTEKTSEILKHGLNLLGIETVEKM